MPSPTKETDERGKPWSGGAKEEREKQLVADPRGSKTSNKIASKETLVVSHNMVKLEIAGNQLNQTGSI